MAHALKQEGLTPSQTLKFGVFFRGNFLSLLSSVCEYELVQLWSLCFQQTARAEPSQPPCTGPGTCSAPICFFPGTELGISLKNRNFAGQQLLRGGESARPADTQQSRASAAQPSHAQCPARLGPQRASTCHRPSGQPPQHRDLASGCDHPCGSSEGSAAGAPSLPPAQRSAGHDQARTAYAFCPSLTFPLPAGLGWDDQARRPLILLLDPGAAPLGSPGNRPPCKAPGAVGEEEACDALRYCCKTERSRRPARPHLHQFSQTHFALGLQSSQHDVLACRETHRQPRPLQLPPAGLTPPQSRTRQLLRQVVPSPFGSFGSFGSFANISLRGCN